MIVTGVSTWEVRQESATDADEPRLAAWTRRTDWPMTGLAAVFLAVYAWQVPHTSVSALLRDALQVTMWVIWRCSRPTTSPACSGTLGALLLGVHDAADGRLRFVGRVGTGFTQTTLRDLQAMLEARARPTSPFDERVPREDARGAHWTEPDLVGEVEYRQWTPTDNRLRHPSWRGLRADKSPRQVKAPFFD